MSQTLAGAAAAVPECDGDDALVSAALERTEDFGLLYHRYLPPIYRYIFAQVSSREEADDLTQVVFVRAFSSLAGYRSKRASFATWLYRIARNAVIDARRRRRRTLSWDGLPEALVAADTPGPDALAEDRERLARLQGLLRRIDPGKQELLALRFGSGLSAREIAPIVGKSEAAVKKQLTRTIATLKELYVD